MIASVEKRFPHLYYSVRNTLLFLIIVTSIIWIVSGFDGTIHSTFNFTPIWSGETNQNYGVGLHWSTALNFLVIIYVGFINWGEGGIKSFSELAYHIYLDLYVIRYYHRHRSLRFLFQAKNSVIYGFIYSFLIGVAGLFIFELFWVFLYDFYQFGSWMYPVYLTHVPGMGFLGLEYPLLRNLAFALFTIPLALIVILFPTIKTGGGFKALYKIRFRKNLRIMGPLLLFTVCLWGLWIAYPYEHRIVGVEDLTTVFTASNSTVIQDPDLYIFPSQTQGFPQTAYTFYPIETLNGRVELEEIYGFYVQDDPIHLLNVVTKVFTTILVAYPLMIFVEKRIYN